MTPDMTPERWRRIAAVFHDALARNPPTRGVFLDRACAADTGLREEVDRLLAAHHAAGRFGEDPIHALPPIGPLDIRQETASVEASPAGESSSPCKGRQPVLACVWIAAALTLAMFGHAAWLLIATGGNPSLGWGPAQRGGQWYVAGVQPSGPAAGRLQAGDRVIRMNGVVPVGRLGIYFQRRGLAAGDTYSLTIERGGVREDHRLAVVATRNLPVWLTWFVVSLIWCAIGLFIGFARPEGALPRLACAAALATGLVFLQVGVISSGPLWQPLHVILGYHFFSRFPEGSPSRGAWQWALRWMYVGAIPHAAFAMWTHGAVLTVGTAAAAELAGPLAGLTAAAHLVATVAAGTAMVGMILVLPHNYRLLTDPDHRRRVRWVVSGSLVGLAPQLWWLGVDLFDRYIGPAPVSRYSLFVNAATIAIPITVAYAVVQHRVLDVEVVVRRGVKYLLARRVLQTAVALPVIALAFTIAGHRHLTIAELAIDTRAYLFWLAAAGLALWFRQPVESWIDRRFFRDASDSQQLLVELLDDVGRVDSIAELSRLVSDRLAAALHPTSAYVWYRDPDDLAAASASDPQITPRDVPSSGRWLSWLDAQRAATALPAPADAGLSHAEARWFMDRGVRLVVPIIDTDDRLVGALLVGEKKSEEPYSVRDRELLGAIARQAAVVRENLRLRARITEDARVRHDVLARLDGRIPNLLKECPTCGACFDGAVDRCHRDDVVLTLSLPVARTIDGKYRLDRLIGKGGMGAVYEAQDLRLGRPVAVKILLGRAFGQQPALRRFRREARAAAQLSHLNVVAVHDFGSLEGDGAYLVMERVRGLTLRAVLDSQRLMPPALAAEWFDQMLDGIGAVHAHGIVHRDLKPANVMGHRDESGLLTVKILDLGLVKMRPDVPVSGAMTDAGVVMGTFGYMSPEQFLGHDVNHRTDLFAVGVMLIEALAGRMPFQGHSYADFLQDLQQASSALPDSLPHARALRDLLQRCVAEDRDDRFPSAEAFRRELIPLLGR